MASRCRPPSEKARASWRCTLLPSARLSLAIRLSVMEQSERLMHSAHASLLQLPVILAPAAEMLSRVSRGRPTLQSWKQAYTSLLRWSITLWVRHGKSRRSPSAPAFTRSRRSSKTPLIHSWRIGPSAPDCGVRLDVETDLLPGCFSRPLERGRSPEKNGGFGGSREKELRCAYPVCIGRAGCRLQDRQDRQPRLALLLVGLPLEGLRGFQDLVPASRAVAIAVASGRADANQRMHVEARRSGSRPGRGQGRG